MKREIIVIAIAFVVRFVSFGATWSSGCHLTAVIDTADYPMLASAYGLLHRDLMSVLGSELSIGSPGEIEVSINPHCPDLYGLSQAFKLESETDGQISIIGSDEAGAAYGIIELTRLLGVSPWEWWADAKPMPQETFSLAEGYSTVQSPSVEYRGIFINDEDWGLMPWSCQNYEPAEPGRIGPQTTARIFELMLRLRANYYWPPMHECTYPFFLTHGNREIAKKYGIYVGGSHCEPMASSAATEWKLRGHGDYDYVNNPEMVYEFWEERVKEVADQPIVYTIGMRGIHDGAMQGAATTESQRDVLTRVFNDQRHLLARYVNADSTQVPQVFIPYKEVLDVYNSGLEIPEDVCLMWCDDNYGYIKHFPNAEESTRTGGNGVYYHVSYWGRPHDYLWLGTASPYLLYQQMEQAYESGIRRMWILNVGDIKAAEYQTELFLDMAWDFHKIAAQGPQRHLQSFLEREFGIDVAEKLTEVMDTHYRLAFVRKPEFMGATREEEWDTPQWRVVKDLPWDIEYINNRLSEYQGIGLAVKEIEELLPQCRRDEFYQLVRYPVQASEQMNIKCLSAQLARHGLEDWNRCDEAYDSIVSLTRYYSELQGGKWRGIMDCQPRNLPVFAPLEHRKDSTSMPMHKKPIATINATDIGGESYQGLGYSGSSALLRQNHTYPVSLPAQEDKSYEVQFCFIPTHPLIGTSLRIRVTDDNGNAMEFDYATRGRSEEWKENVLNNRSIRSFYTSNAQSLTIKALDPGIILDQILVFEL